MIRSRRWARVGRVRIYGGSPGCLLLSLAATVLELF